MKYNADYMPIVTPDAYKHQSNRLNSIQLYIKSYKVGYQGNRKPNILLHLLQEIFDIIIKKLTFFDFLFGAVSGQSGSSGSKHSLS